MDDSPTIRKMIMAALKPLNPVYGEAGSGLEAIEQLAIRSYDAVMLDLNMPDMHGLEFIRFVRGNSVFRKIPIVVITTRSDDHTRDITLSAGANYYMTKPFSPGDLVYTIKSLLQPE